MDKYLYNNKNAELNFRKTQNEIKKLTIFLCLVYQDIQDALDTVSEHTKSEQKVSDLELGKGSISDLLQYLILSLIHI